MIAFNFSENDYVIDTFAVTRPMSTFTFGFVMSELEMLSKTQLTDVHLKNVCVKIYGRSEMLDELDRAVSLMIVKYSIRNLIILYSSLESLRTSRKGLNFHAKLSGC